MELSNRDRLYKDLLARDGRDRFILKMVEELNELSVAIIHYTDGKISSDDLLGEVADVMIQLGKLGHLFGNDYLGRDIFEQAEPFMAMKIEHLKRIVYADKKGL